MVQGTQTEEEHLMLRMEIMRMLLRLRMLLKKNLLTLRILKIMNLNWKNFDDRGVIFSHFYVYCISLHYIG